MKIAISDRGRRSGRSSPYLHITGVKGKDVIWGELFWGGCRNGTARED